MANSDAHEKLLHRFKSDTRSILISSPMGVLKRSFRHEYKSLIGSEPPLKQLGYQSMDQFVRDHPDVVVERIGVTGEPTYFVVANEETKNVASLVARQKKPSVKKLRKATAMSHRPSPRPAAFLPPNRKQIRPIRSFRPFPNKPTTRYETPRYHSNAVGVPVVATSMRSNTAASPAGIPPWKPQFERAKAFKSVSELVDTKEMHCREIVAVIGYPGHQDRILQYANEHRLLLFDKFINNNYLKRPCINVFFAKGFWNVKDYPDPITLPPSGGVRVQIWGSLEYKYWKNAKEYRHSMKALYYKKQTIVSSPMSDLRITAGNVLPMSNLRITTTSGNARSVMHIMNVTNITSGTKSPLMEHNNRPNKTPNEWLKDFIDNKPNGVFAEHVKSEFVKQFSESPDKFMDLIRQLPFIAVEEIGGKLVLFKKTPETNCPLPNTVVLPVDEMIDILVVSLASPLDFYVQHISSSTTEELEKLEDKLKKHFGQSKEHSSFVKLDINKLYAVCWEDGETWCRTRIIALPSDSSNEVQVSYPDYGNEECVKISQLRPLSKEFYELPFQAIHCKLNGVNETNKIVDKKLDELIFEKNCCCQVKNKCKDDNGDEEYTVDLWIDDHHINATVDDILYPLDTLCPSLPKVPTPDDNPINVILRDIDMTGAIILNVEGKGTEKLEELNNLINCHHTDEMVSSPHVDMVFCAKYEDNFYRVKIQSLDDDKVTVSFVDYGNVLIIPISMLRPPLKHPLFSLPPQAITCQLKDVPPPQCGWSINATNWLAEYIDTRLTLQMVTETHCILYNLDNENINDLMLKESIELFPISYSLKITDYQTQSLDVADYTYVYVSHATSPSNFTVQNCHYVEKLNVLQKSLHEYSSQALPVHLYQSGLLCLAQSNDECWYRGVLMDTVILKDDGDALVEEVPVKYLDYGDSQLLPTANVRQLNPDHLNLPFQGIPVQLQAVRPVGGEEWDKPTCDKFQELVIDKYYFCRVVQTVQDGQCTLVSMLDPVNNKLLSHTLVEHKLATFITNN